MGARIGNKSAQKYMKNDDYWREPTIENSYIAGFIAADGSLTKNQHSLSIVLAAYDMSILEYISKVLAYTGKIYNKFQKGYTYPMDSKTIDMRGKTLSASMYAKLQIYAAQQYYTDLYKWYNITPNKTFSLQPPNITDPDHIRAYIFGVFMGDGGLFWDKPNKRWISGFTGDSSIIDWIKDYLSLNTGTVGHRSSGGVSYSQRDTYKLLDYFTPVMHLPHLERKTNFDKYWEHREWKANRKRERLNNELLPVN